MINVIERNVLQSKKDKRTNRFLVDFVFNVVHKSLLEHYKGNYSMQCVQSSIVISRLLDKIGIKSTVIAGAACLPEIKGTNPYKLTYSGFWDKDHHVWLATEFYEIVDLTISHFNFHPVSAKKDAHAIPPIWWYPCDLMPSIIKYLPQSKNVMLETEYLADLELLQILTDAKYNDEIKGEIEDFSPELRPLLDVDGFNQLYSEGDHWALGCALLSNSNHPLPDWVVEREKQLLIR